MRGAVSRMFMVSPCLADPAGQNWGSRPRSASLLPRRLYCQDPGVRNDGVRDYFVAMTRVFRCGNLEVKGFTDGKPEDLARFRARHGAGGLRGARRRNK